MAGGIQPRRQITSEETVRYGHIAATLRLYLETFRLRPGSFARMVWPQMTPSSVYPWIHGYAPPPESRRAALADFMGVPIALLTPREPDDPPAPRLPNPKGLRPPPGSQAVQVIAEPTEVTLPRETWNARANVRASSGADVLGFRLHPDGTATITLNVTLSSKHAWALLRTLSDAGIETYYEEQEHEPS